MGPMSRLRPHIPRLTFLLGGLALAALVANAFLWYGAAQAPDVPFLPVQHRACGQPVSLRAEDYNLWGESRRGDDIELALLDFCDPVRVLREDGKKELWFWMSVETTGQVFPYVGWGYPWSDVETPFPADDREPRNPWWAPRTGIRAYPAELGYAGGDGYACPHNEVEARGVDLFFYREEGFQLPVGARHAGWVCLYFDDGNSLPDALTVTVRPDRARITQWVDRFYVVQNAINYDEAAIPAISGHQLCDYARRTHPDSVQEAACPAG